MVLYPEKELPLEIDVPVHGDHLLNSAFVKKIIKGLVRCQYNFRL